MKTINSYLISILLLVNLLVSCGKLIDEAEANQPYQRVELFGYECITNYQSIWCN